MKITQVEAIPFAIPYVKPLKFASGEVHTAGHVLVRVHTDDGVSGVAEAPPRPFTYGETQASIIAVIQQLFAPQVVGRTLPEREAIGARVARTVGNPTAKAAIDMAIWDALGRTSGRQSAICSAATPTGCGSVTCSALTIPPRWSPRPKGCGTPMASAPSR